MSLLLDAIIVVVKQDRSLQHASVCLENMHLFCQCLRPIFPKEEVQAKAVRCILTCSASESFVLQFIEKRLLAQLCVGLEISDEVLAPSPPPPFPVDGHLL